MTTKTPLDRKQRRLNQDILNQDILILIIEQLFHISPRSAVNFSLASKYFQGLAYPIIFRSIRIGGPTGDGPGTPYLRRDASAVSRDLRYLVPFVREIIVGENDCDGAVVTEVRKLLVSLQLLTQRN